MRRFALSEHLHGMSHDATVQVTERVIGRHLWLNIARLVRGSYPQLVFSRPRLPREAPTRPRPWMVRPEELRLAPPGVAVEGILDPCYLGARRPRAARDNLPPSLQVGRPRQLEGTLRHLCLDRFAPRTPSAARHDVLCRVPRRAHGAIGHLQAPDPLYARHRGPTRHNNAGRKSVVRR